MHSSTVVRYRHVAIDSNLDCTWSNTCAQTIVALDIIIIVGALLGLTTSFDFRFVIVYVSTHGSDVAMELTASRSLYEHTHICSSNFIEKNARAYQFYYTI